MLVKTNPPLKWSKFTEYTYIITGFSRYHITIDFTMRCVIPAWIKTSNHGWTIQTEACVAQDLGCIAHSCPCCKWYRSIPNGWWTTVYNRTKSFQLAVGCIYLYQFAKSMSRSTNKSTQEMPLTMTYVPAQSQRFKHTRSHNSTVWEHSYTKFTSSISTLNVDMTHIKFHGNLSNTVKKFVPRTLWHRLTKQFYFDSSTLSLPRNFDCGV